MFLGFKNLFVGSLHSKPQLGFELITFSAIPGYKFCHGNNFIFFWGLYINIFVGSLHGNTFLLFLGPIYKYFCGFFAFHTPGLELLSFFGQYLATILVMVTLFLFFYLYMNILKVRLCIPSPSTDWS